MNVSEDGLTQTATDQHFGETTEDGRHPADRIADFLEEHGWIQKQFKTDDGYCVGGAAIELLGFWGYFKEDSYNQVRDRVQAYYPNRTINSLAAWNDTPGLTKEEVLKALRGQK